MCSGSGRPPGRPSARAATGQGPLFGRPPPARRKKRRTCARKVHDGNRGGLAEESGQEGGVRGGRAPRPGLHKAQEGRAGTPSLGRMKPGEKRRPAVDECAQLRGIAEDGAVGRGLAGGARTARRAPPRAARRRPTHSPPARALDMPPAHARPFGRLPLRHARRSPRPDRRLGQILRAAGTGVEDAAGPGRLAPGDAAPRLAPLFRSPARSPPASCPPRPPASGPCPTRPLRAPSHAFLPPRACAAPDRPDRQGAPLRSPLRRRPRPSGCSPACGRPLRRGRRETFRPCTSASAGPRRPASPPAMATASRRRARSPAGASRRPARTRPVFAYRENIAARIFGHT